LTVSGVVARPLRACAVELPGSWRRMPTALPGFLGISLGRFREAQIALLLAICESRMPLTTDSRYAPNVRMRR